MKISPDLFIKGYYIISVPADRFVRLMNYCQKKDISLSEFHHSDIKFFSKLFQKTQNTESTLHNENSQNKIKCFVISHREYKALTDFLEKAQIQCEILKDKGLPALLSKKGTRFFLASVLLLIMGMFVSSRYIWNINVTGSTYYTGEQIKKWVSENVVTIGSKKKGIICSELEHQIKEGLNRVEWVSCSIEGTTLVIDIYDTNSTAKKDSTTSDYSQYNLSDIISDTDCIITDIIPVSGTALVAVGDEVKKGDVLISSEVTIYNDYGEEVDTSYVEAMGYITGMVTEEFNQSISYERQEKVYDEGFKCFAIGFGDAYVNIFSPKITAQYDTETELKRLAFNDSFFLPFSIAVYNIHPYSVIQLTNDENELKTALSKRLAACISDLQKKGVEIVENNVKMYVNEDGCTAKGSILYKKTIGCRGE